MANKFTNFLKGFFEGSGNLRDYQHAARLYVDDYYKLSPKAGWLYYVVLNINQFVLDSPVFNPSWKNRYGKNVGVLAKAVDLPNFTIATQILNQYNRKTVIQTGIIYNPIKITFHNDMENVTNELWRSYYNYYYADGRYSRSGGGNNPITTVSFPREFLDNKLIPTDDVVNSMVRYGLNNNQNIPFFDTIKIYTLNRQQYSSVTLINPLVNQWSQQSLQQDSSELLDSTMVLNYESVFYDNENKSITNSEPGFNLEYYDNAPSPLSIGGVGSTSLLGPGGIVAGVKDIFGDLGELKSNSDPLSILNTAIKARNLAKQADKLSKQSIKEEGLNILNSVIKDVAKTSNAANPTTQQNTALGSGAINFFTESKSLTNNLTKAQPKIL